MAADADSCVAAGTAIDGTPTYTLGVATFKPKTTESCYFSETPTAKMTYTATWTSTDVTITSLKVKNGEDSAEADGSTDQKKTGASITISGTPAKPGSIKYIFKNANAASQEIKVTVTNSASTLAAVSAVASLAYMAL